MYSTMLREQDNACMNYSRWSTLVGLKPTYTHMWVARSTTVLTDTDEYWKAYAVWESNLPY